MPSRRQARRTTARRVAAAAMQAAFSEYMHAQAALEDDADCWEDGGIRSCRACDGDGRDKWSDYLLECEHCSGTGREGW